MTNTLVYNIGDKDIEFKVKETVPYADIDIIVETIAKSVFNDEGDYRPASFNYIMWYAILNKYTDLDLDDIGMDTVLALADDNEFVGMIRQNISNEQFYRIEDCAMSKIDYILKEHPLKKTCAYINKFIEAYGDSIAAAMNNEDLINAVKVLVEKQK